VPSLGKRTNKNGGAAVRALLLKIRRAFLSNSFIEHYFSSPSFRIQISLLLSFLFNLAYLAFNFISGFVYKSSSFITVALYYALLLSIRYILLNADSERNERDVCVRGGALLLLTDLLITLMIFYSAISGTHKEYGKIVFLALSLHAAYSLIRAAVGLFKSRADNAPTHKAAYSVRIASASMSFYNFFSAIASSFVKSAELSHFLLVALGSAVSLTVFALSLKMIFSWK
jgi:hypothetical protein